MRVRRGAVTSAITMVLGSACARSVEPVVGASEEPAVVVEGEPAAGAEALAPAPDPEHLVFERTTRGELGCVVTIAALLDAEEYRGAGPMTPALEASFAADPEFARMWDAESHGDHHIQCHYEIRLGGAPLDRYRWRVVHSNTLRNHTTEVCKRELGAVAEDIILTTAQCTDFAAGAYYGYVLEPI